MCGPRSSLYDRLLSVCCYLGLAPLTKLLRRPSPDPLLEHHRIQAMSALFLLLLLFLAACALDTAETVVFVGFPDLGQHLIARFGQMAVLLNYARTGVVVLLGMFWISLLGLAVQGSAWKVPLLKSFSERKWIIRLASVANMVVLVLIPLVATFAVYATSLTRRSIDSPSPEKLDTVPGF